MPKALHLLFDLGKTICYPGMKSALKDPGALRDIGQILAEKGSHFGRLELLRAFLKVYGAYAQEAEATNREWRKPDPRIFAEACQELKVTPGECLFVGDKEKADIIGARNYGMFTIKFQPQGLFLKSSAADFRIRKWSELKQVVESIAVEARI